MSSMPECIKCGEYIHSGFVVCENCNDELPTIRAELSAIRAENARLRYSIRAAWIPVTEKLPDERGYYLAAGKWFTDVNWTTVLYFDDDQEWYSGQSLRRSTTHWRPLPAHPQEQP